MTFDFLDRMSKHADSALQVLLFIVIVAGMGCFIYLSERFKGRKRTDKPWKKREKENGY